ncbi:hypothetical protein P4O66_001356 [Electrophorus voltai]|uniref:Uncharacterized protein n=1 Tax=Electrophorus voltai TaxID=2609070 RepID=A0AAD9DTE1_9TELE|nr:hypothetical protein P4O66_001356 [Electrophorus voltai]
MCAIFQDLSRNIDRSRMPGKKNKKEKGKKARNRSSPLLTRNPSIFLGTFDTATTGESAPGKFFWGGPGCSSGEDSAESYRPLMDYESWYKGDHYPGLDSARSYYPYRGYQESYREYEWSEGHRDASPRLEDTDVSFRSDSEVHQEKNPAMEVEEVSLGDGYRLDGFRE